MTLAGSLQAPALQPLHEKVAVIPPSERAAILRVTHLRLGSGTTGAGGAGDAWFRPRCATIEGAAGFGLPVWAAAAASLTA